MGNSKRKKKRDKASQRPASGTFPLFLAPKDLRKNQPHKARSGKASPSKQNQTQNKQKDAAAGESELEELN
jgi:hypothetical protein